MRSLTIRTTVASLLLLAGSASAQPLFQGHDDGTADPVAFTGTAYLVHGGVNVGATAGGELARLDLTTGALTTIGLPTGRGLTGLAYANVALYAADDQGNLVTMSLDGTARAVTPFTGEGFSFANGDRVTDLTSDPQGNLYGAIWLDAANQIVRIDTDGTITALGMLREVGGFPSIAYATGFLYAMAAGSTEVGVYELDGTYIRQGRPDDGTGLGALGLG